MLLLLQPCSVQQAGTPPPPGEAAVGIPAPWREGPESGRGLLSSRSEVWDLRLHVHPPGMSLTPLPSSFASSFPTVPSQGFVLGLLLILTISLDNFPSCLNCCCYSKSPSFAMTPSLSSRFQFPPFCWESPCGRTADQSDSSTNLHQPQVFPLRLPA